MNDVKVLREVLLAEAEEAGILDKVKAHESRLAARFIQQPTEEDLVAYALALAVVTYRATELMANAEPQVKAGQTEPAPIEVDLQPTEEQIAAGLKELHEQGMDVAPAYCTPEDAIVFLWQAMIGARPK